MNALDAVVDYHDGQRCSEVDAIRVLFNYHGIVKNNIHSLLSDIQNTLKGSDKDESM